MRRPSISFLTILFAVFAFLTVAAANADITDAEARLLWIVRDPERVEPAAIGDTARLLARNFRAMLDRAGTGDLPLAVPLDIWTTATGGSIFAARIGVIIALFGVTAVLTWLIRRFGIRRAPAGKLVVVALLLMAIAGVLLLEFGSYGPPVSGVVASYQAERHPAEPVITVFSDDSPLGYYQAQVDLRRGVGVDLGWRKFKSEEIERVASSLGPGTVWLIVEDYDYIVELTDQALRDTGRRAVSCNGRYPGEAVIRYDRVGADTDINNELATCPDS